MMLVLKGRGWCRKGETVRFDVNLSILFTELDPLRRPEAAHRAGFDAVESWWPFTVAVPTDAEVDRFVLAVGNAGVALVALNFFAGAMTAGERGVLSHPNRSREFRDSVDVAAGIGDRLGCRAFNALYGNRLEDVSIVAQDAAALENLAYAACALSRIDGTVLIEPLSAMPRYPLRAADEVFRLIDRVREDGVENLQLLFDLYHLTINGDDPDVVLDSSPHRIGHVQVADAPGRREPGTGEIDFAHYFDRLRAVGYPGHIGLEYHPSAASADSFGWIDEYTRSLPEGTGT
jgi:hydroxypyruvate isomerase